MHVRRPARSPILAILLVAAGAGAACVIVQSPEDLAEWRGRFERLVPFPSAGGTLDLRNENGDVEVQGWTRDEAEILAEYLPARRPTGVRWLGWTGDRPDVDVKRDDDTLRVRALSGDAEDNGEPIHFAVRLPQAVTLDRVVVDRGSLGIADLYGRIDCEVGEGDLRVANFSGSIAAVLGDGDAAVEVLDLRERDQVTIEADAGSIVLRLEPGARFSLEAEAGGGGEVRSDFDLGGPRSGPRLSGRTAETGARIRLRTGSGDVRVETIRPEDTAGRPAARSGTA